MTEQLKTIKEAALETGYTEQHFRLLIKAGKISAVRVGGRRVMVDVSEVERIKAERNKVEEINQGGGESHGSN